MTLILNKNEDRFVICELSRSEFLMINKCEYMIVLQRIMKNVSNIFTNFMSIDVMRFDINYLNSIVIEQRRHERE